MQIQSDYNILNSISLDLTSVAARSASPDVKERYSNVDFCIPLAHTQARTRPCPPNAPPRCVQYR